MPRVLRESPVLIFRRCRRCWRAAGRVLLPLPLHLLRGDGDGGDGGPAADGEDLKVSTAV